MPTILRKTEIFLGKACFRHVPRFRMRFSQKVLLFFEIEALDLAGYSTWRLRIRSRNLQCFDTSSTASVTTLCLCSSWSRCANLLVRDQPYSCICVSGRIHFGTEQEIRGAAIMHCTMQLQRICQLRGTILRRASRLESIIPAHRSMSLLQLVTSSSHSTLLPKTETLTRGEPQISNPVLLAFHD